jgi:hypothetical protein
MCGTEHGCAPRCWGERGQRLNVRAVSERFGPARPRRRSVVSCNTNVQYSEPATENVSQTRPNTTAYSVGHASYCGMWRHQLSRTYSFSKRSRRRQRGRLRKSVRTAPARTTETLDRATDQHSDNGSLGTQRTRMGQHPKSIGRKSITCVPALPSGTQSRKMLR